MKFLFYETFLKNINKLIKKLIPIFTVKLYFYRPLKPIGNRVLKKRIFLIFLKIVTNKFWHFFCRFFTKIKIKLFQFQKNHLKVFEKKNKFKWDPLKKIFSKRSRYRPITFPLPFLGLRYRLLPFFSKFYTLIVTLPILTVHTR